MRRIDELHLDYPIAGSRMLRDFLNREGIPVGPKHVSTLMRRMGIEALYRKPNTSKRHPAHAVHPYLLRGLTIDRPNQVWAKDLTYIPMARGFVYLKAYDSVSHARESLGRYIRFYNSGRPHSSLDRRTPDEVYFKLQALPAAA